jgi:hypothetical protein
MVSSRGEHSKVLHIRLIQLLGEDQKQAQLLEFLEPLMDDMASDDKTAREEARAEIRKLLSR